MTGGWNRWAIRAWLSAVVVAGCTNMGASMTGASLDYRAIVAAADRAAADREMDARRNPEQMLVFIEVRPGMRALDMGAGGGYTTELLARAVGPQGRVYAHNVRQRDTFDERVKKPVMQNVVKVIRPFDDPIPPDAKDLDVVTLILNYHDTVFMGVDRTAMNRRIFAVLKPGGRYVLADHSAKTGEGTRVAQSLHRIEEATLRQEVEAAGFKLEAQGDFLRNPNDPRTAPYREMSARSDKFVLKFVKPGA